MSRRREGAAYDAIEALMIDSGLPHDVNELVDGDGMTHTIMKKNRRLLRTRQSDGRPRALGNQLRKWTKVRVGDKDMPVMGEDGGL